MNGLASTLLTRFMKSKSFKKVGIFLVLTAPIIVFCIGLLATGTKIAPGDADYLMQTYEAMRRSILEFKQFPWWNPWVSGGVPLFANPQFGLISIQALFVLIFGTFLGYKLALVSFFIIGFWGFKRLFTNILTTPATTAILLSYVWTFGTFLTQRTSGHHTFLIIQLFPWALYFYLNRSNDKNAWIKLSLVLSFMALSSAHNITVMSYLVIAFIAGLQLLHFERVNTTWLKFRLSLRVSKTELLFWLKVAGVFIALTFYRLFYTVQYLRDFPRSPELIDAEPTIGLLNGFLAIFGPLMQFSNSPTVQAWSWLEASSYISIFTFIVFLVVIWQLMQQRKERKKQFSYRPWMLLSLIGLFFAFGMGRIIGPLSPYEILHMLPIISSMRVSYRWLAWCAIFILVFIASYTGKKYRRVINTLLLLAVVELFTYGRMYIDKPFSIPSHQYRQATSTFEQRSHYDVKRLGIPYDENLTDSTRSNYGQIIAGDALVDTRFPAPWGDPTKRCSIDSGCNYVITNNAQITYWSPNKIILKRTSLGTIRLDTNPGQGWRVNGIYTFLHMKTVDPDQDFIITDESNEIIIDYVPRFSIEWAVEKIK